MLKVLLITVFIVFIVMLGLSVRLLFKQKSEFRAGCSSYSHELKDKNIGCGCGGSTGSCQAE